MFNLHNDAPCRLFAKRAQRAGPIWHHYVNTARARLAWLPSSGPLLPPVALPGEQGDGKQVLQAAATRL